MWDIRISKSFGPLCASIPSVKIASQLLNTTPIMTPKATTTLGDGESFQGVFTAAAAVNQAGNNSATGIKAKIQTPDVKSQVSDIKKKSEVSDDIVTFVPAQELPANKQLPTDLVTQVPASMPSTAAQSSEPVTSDSADNVELSGSLQVLSSSAASITAFVPLPINLSSAAWPDKSTVAENRVTTDFPKKATELSVAQPAKTEAASAKAPDAGPIAVPSAATSALPNISLVPPTKEANVAPVGLPQHVTPKTPRSDEAVTPAKQNDSAPSDLTVPARGLATSVQQIDLSMPQIVNATVSQPALASTVELQVFPAAAANLGSFGGKVTDSIKEATSRQTISAQKTKPGFGPSAEGGSTAAASDVNTSIQNTSSVISATVPKVAQTLGTGNQDLPQSKAVLDVASLQQMASSGQTGTLDHTPQSSQAATKVAEPASHGVTVQALPDSAPAQSVSSAQLIQSMRSSEMKLGMQSAEFGNISISTSLGHQTLSAQISFDHLELGRALAVHLPAMEEKLGAAYGMQAKVELRDSSGPSSSTESGYSNSGEQSRQQRQSNDGDGTASSRGLAIERTGNRSSFTPISTAAAASRLDIRI